MPVYGTLGLYKLNSLVVLLNSANVLTILLVVLVVRILQVFSTEKDKIYPRMNDSYYQEAN